MPSGAPCLHHPRVSSTETSPRSVLVVDDRELLRDLTRDALAAAGFEVKVASSGDEAVAVAESEPTLDLLVTDVVMGEMNGPELARRLRTLLPALRVIFMSGHPLEVLREDDLRAPGTAFLHKPFSIAELTAQARQLLED
jgi:two-component system cell cycle sensor histidine kinase/response regulator CckA